MSHREYARRGDGGTALLCVHGIQGSPDQFAWLTIAWRHRWACGGSCFRAMAGPSRVFGAPGGGNGRTV